MNAIDKEVLFQRLFDSSPDCLKLLDTEGNIVDINPAGTEMACTLREELIGQPVYQLVCPEYQRAYAQLIQDARRGKQGPMEMEVCEQDGARRWVNARLAPVIGKRGEVELFVGITRDIHEKKLTQLRTEELARQLLMNQDQERKAIAQELHDDIGQALLAIRINAEFIENRLEKDRNEEKAAVQQIQKLVEGVEHSVRSLSNRLHPLTLRYLGLADSLEELVSIWRITQPEVEISCKLDTEIIGTLTETVALALYRVTQECLCNIARHAQATAADIHLYSNAIIPVQDSVCLLVQDNGSGIDPEQLRLGRGIRSMEKRISALGGQFMIEGKHTAKESGTRVTVIVPLDERG